MWRPLVLLSVTCLMIMTFVDYLIGPQAEFLNAFTVLLRLFNVDPGIPDSLVARHIGSAGELLVVILVNLLIGGVLTLIYRLLIRR